MDRGNLLVSANGNGHSAITTWWVIEIVVAVLCLTMCFGDAKNEMHRVWVGIGVIAAVLCLVMAGLIQSRISRTVVNVYEKCVLGSSVVPKFPLAFATYCSISSLQLAEFQLTYDKISSVDVVNGNIVVINATNVQHKIYAMDARKIRDEILSRKSAVGAA